MTATINETEFEVIEALDFKFETPCDGELCDNSAAWKAVASCCGRMILACEDCHALLVRAEGFAGSLVDYVCDGNVMNLIWERL